MTDTSWTSKRLEILKEHEMIRGTILEIEAELDRLVDRPLRAGGPWELPGLVRSLLGQFKRHFELEENGGLLGADPECYDPDMLLEVAHLIAEHREFERELERILNEMDFDFQPGETVHGCFDTELRKVISALAAHEAAETDLLDQLLARTEERSRHSDSPRP